MNLQCNNLEISLRIMYYLYRFDCMISVYFYLYLQPILIYLIIYMQAHYTL